MDGSLLCASDGAPAGLSSAHPPWVTDLLTTTDLAVGQLVSDPIDKSRFLPIAIHLPGLGAGDQPRVMVAGLNTDWLVRHLETAKVDRAPAMSRAALIIADRDGNILGRVPDSADWAGRTVPEWLRPLINRDNQGVETIVDPDGHTIIAGYVPGTLPPMGLTVINALVLPDLTADIDQATYQDLLVIGGAAIVALVLAWVAGRRFIYQPTEALLQAARRWREGDLGARARLTDAGSEFAALAQSFNAMAAGLQAREMERRMQSSFLEAQVAERTRELSESNNRLQVEIAGREKTEAALHQAQKLQAVGQLAGGIAHDFNNMLATVLGNLELMERRVSQASNDWGAPDTDRLLRLIERATGAVTRGGQLTSRLLAFSRRQRLAARSTDVNALLRELITLATSTLGRRVQVVPELADDLWPAMVDPSQVEAAILNLCLNARDAMPDGGRLTIRTIERGDRAGQQPACRQRACAGRLRAGVHFRHRDRHVAGGEGPGVRSVLHDQGPQRRFGAGAEPSLWHGAPVRRQRRDRQHAERGDPRHAVPAARDDHSRRPRRRRRRICSICPSRARRANLSSSSMMTTRSGRSLSRWRAIWDVRWRRPRAGSRHWRWSISYRRPRSSSCWTTRCRE